MRSGNKMKVPVSESEGLLKAQRFCAYQERCIKELEEKLKEWCVEEKFHNSIIDALIEDNFINELRFTDAFVSGKFGIKSWGKIKIRAELRKRRIDDRLISESLDKLDQQKYIAALNRLVDKKIKEVEDVSNLHGRNKILWFLVSKGYEKELILEALKGRLDIS